MEALPGHAQTSGIQIDIFKYLFHSLMIKVGLVVSNGEIILRSTDGGARIGIYKLSGTEDNITWSLTSFDENIGTAVGPGGTILRTTNGGVTFIELKMDQIQHQQTLFIISKLPQPIQPSYNYYLSNSTDRICYTKSL